MQKRTKIVATVASNRCSQEFLQALFEAGVNVVRLNTAHQNPEEAAATIDQIRAVSDSVAILIDTKGPEIRTVPGGETLTVTVGQPLRVIGDPSGSSQGNVLYLSLPNLPQQVPVGSSLLIDDGELELEVTAHDGDALVCMPGNDGLIKNRKSVNIPNVPVDLPTLSERDREFLRVAAEHDVDFVAHSFVRTREDVIELQQYLNSLGSSAKIIAKIENQQGVDNIDQILDHVYGIMVARGDLGIEIPGERVPYVQRMIVKKCIESKRPVIIATQMLHSMIENPRPTRAEISDVANAIYQRTDAIMLSGETAYGKYPIEAVQTMARIAAEIESHLAVTPDQHLHRVGNPITESLTRAAVRVCTNMPISAVVVDTLTGRTARYLSAFRSQAPIYAICYQPQVMRQLSLSYGVEPMQMEMRESRDAFLSESLSMLVHQKRFKAHDPIVIIGGSFGPSNGATFMEISKAGDLIAKPYIHDEM